MTQGHDVSTPRGLQFNLERYLLRYIDLLMLLFQFQHPFDLIWLACMHLAMRKRKKQIKVLTDGLILLLNSVNNQEKWGMNVYKRQCSPDESKLRLSLE